ncbi:hypothetical protein NP493_222g05017 [Ridgeia piscesae]|uniref:LEM domain-containing protein n=1 Tax=Ridgeia piscesae TaxID=27915 RepID=A0AAD9P0M2_RIDPI|nr:hypothetical protein NP493_222g05017 [Ridgeia piscesae]
MASLEFTQEQIEVMSNAELLETLRQHGINCGPIVPSTRLVYQKKLLNILSGGLVPWKQATGYEMEEGRHRTESYSDKGDEEEENADIFDSTEEEDEMTPAKLNIVQTKRGKAVAPERLLASGSLPKSPRRRIVPDPRFSRSDAGSELSQSQQSSDEMMIAESEKLLKPLKKERRVPVYLQVLIFIFVSIIIYLIIYNLEPVFKHPISRH